MGAASVPDADDVAAALRTDAVFVADSAERALSPSEAESLRESIDVSSTPVFVAVLPDSSGDPDVLLPEIVDATALDGTYVLLVGDTLRAGSTELARGRAGDLATASLDAHRADGTFAVLDDLVGRFDAEARTSTSSGSSSGETSTETSRPAADDDGGLGAGAWLLGGVAIVVGALVWRSSRKRRAEAIRRAQEEQAEREMLRAELSVLADDVISLQDDVQLHPDAGNDYESAVSRYKAAQAALDTPNARVDLVRVRCVVDEARYSMERARARVEGREPPPPPYELRRPGDHGEPAIALDERNEPVYVGYPGSYGGGWYGMGGGLFTGMLLGSMLGGWGWGGYGDTTIVNNYPDGGGDWDGGGSDFGGGSFGGGDFGDFGGGDFGGGDFGGGDF